jgi:hypothetical protein
MNPSVEYMVANLKKLEKLRHQIAVDHGFAYKRAQHFKNCVVIRFKHRKRKNKDFIDHERIEEYVGIAHAISDHYQLWDEKHMFLEAELRLAKIGIYVKLSWCNIWAIPNSLPELQEYVLGLLPEWAEVTKK